MDKRTGAKDKEYRKKISQKDRKGKNKLLKKQYWGMIMFFLKFHTHKKSYNKEQSELTREGIKNNKPLAAKSVRTVFYFSDYKNLKS